MKKLCVLLFAVLIGTIPVYVMAQQAAADYPAKQVRVIITSTAGGPTDVVARLLAASLEKQFHQPFIVESRPGANGLIALDAVAKAPPDGYTLAVSHSGFPAEEVKNKTWNLRFSRDFTMISVYAGGGSLLIVPSTMPVNNIVEFAAYAKANPGKVNQAVMGEGAPERIRLLWRKLGIDDAMTDVRYKGGGPATQSIAQGESHMWTSALSDALPYIQSGRIKAVAYTEAERHPLLPSVPTVQESSPTLSGYTFEYWFAFMGPAGLPSAIVRKLYAGTQAGLKDQELRSRVGTLGMRVFDRGPEQSTELVNGEIKLERDLTAAAAASK